MIELDEEMRAHLHAEVDDLVNTTGGMVPREQLAELVEESFHSIAAHATIGQFLPILAGRYARTRLRADDLDSGRLLKDKPEVLVLCELNRGRSQAAAALFRFYAPGELQVESAGSHPGKSVNSRVNAYLRIHGVQLTDYPKPFTDNMVKVADHLVIIGDLSRALPDVSGQDRQFWAIPDIEDADGPQISDAMHEINTRVRAALREWLPELALPQAVVG